MESLNDILLLLRTWGTFFGLILNALGASLLFIGIKNLLAESKRIETFISSQLHEVTWENKLENALSVRDMRAKERRQAKNLALLGLLLFILGTALQAFSNFPVR